MKKLISICLLCIIFTINADPTPFGLEIGKATIKDVKKKYKAHHSGENRYTGGDMYSLDTSIIGIDGLQSATAIFDKKNRLVAMLTTFSKNKFQFLFDTMRQKKYKLAKKNIPFVGNKTAQFTDGKTTVYLDAPHLSFEMSLNYIDNKTYKEFQKAQQQEKQLKKRTDQSKL